MRGETGKAGDAGCVRRLAAGRLSDKRSRRGGAQDRDALPPCAPSRKKPTPRPKSSATCPSWSFWATRPDLRGNAKRRERTPNGGADGNVFDIQQGAAVHRADLWGTRESMDESPLTPILRRPFNMRHACYDDPLIARRRHSVMRHMLAGTNLGLVFMRQVALDDDYTRLIMGGYQPLRKRLKDSQCRALSFAYLDRYRAIAAALRETIRLTDAVYREIARCGVMPSGERRG